MKIITLLLFLLYISPHLSAEISIQKDLEKGDSIPDFTIIDANGRIFHSRQTEQFPTVLVFFHTSCRDCQTELPIIQEIKETYPHPIRLICISRAEDDASIRSFWKQNRLSLRYSAQQDKRIFQLFARKTIPRIYIVSSQGIITSHYKGKVSKRKILRGLRKALNA